MSNIQLTQELVKYLFDYKDGFLYWKISLSNRVRVGDKAGSIDKNANRYKVFIKGKYYVSSRLIFLWVKGYLPEMVDHKDRNTLNNRIENLRPATRTENQRNRTSGRNSKSMYLGVSRSSRSDRWVAQIFINKKLKYLGSFKVESDAALAYNKVAAIHFGEFANLNIIK